MFFGQRSLKPLGQQTMVVVGASSGIGRATALKAAKAGARVLVAARNEEGLHSLVQEIRSHGGVAESVAADVTDYDQVAAVSQAALNHFGGFDTWVHVSGAGLYAQFVETPPAEFRQLIQTNLIGAAYGAMVALQHLRQVDAGALILLSSVEGEVPFPFHSAYAASKHGIEGFAGSLRLELEHEKSGVSLTLIRPAGVDTPFFANAKTYLGVEPRPPAPVYNPEQVADAILFAAHHRTPEMFVGGASRAFISLRRSAPALLHRAMLWTAFESQKTKTPKGPEDGSNLYAPERHDERTHGNLGPTLRPVSLFTWAETHPYTANTLKLALVGGALYAVARHYTRET
ncbi:MAG: SDR family oxidoreductase [Verrucomicrobia bacterium]|nr:SDR family oxidoreductase [Verrucomicrobiota bacterium]